MTALAYILLALIMVVVPTGILLAFSRKDGTDRDSE